MRILLVDDSNTIHLYIKSLLDSKNIEFDDAYDGLEAVEKLKKSSDYSLVLLDWEMPNLNGIETLAAIREFNTDIPILMVTTKSDPKLIAEAFERGADEYVMKPFTKEILIDKLTMVLGEEVA